MSTYDSTSHGNRSSGRGNCDDTSALHETAPNDQYDDKHKTSRPSIAFAVGSLIRANLLISIIVALAVAGALCLLALRSAGISLFICAIVIAVIAIRTQDSLHWKRLPEFWRGVANGNLIVLGASLISLPLNLLYAVIPGSPDNPTALTAMEVTTLLFTAIGFGIAGYRAGTDRFAQLILIGF